jgi:hypothetical protein
MTLLAATEIDTSAASYQAYRASQTPAERASGRRMRHCAAAASRPVALKKPP